MSDAVEWALLCELNSLAEHGGCKEFRYRYGDDMADGFAVRLGDAVYGYRNSCPHLSIPMNWLPDVLLDNRRRHIHCALHGALFEIDTGQCIKGPCFGRYLEPVAVRLEAGRVLVAGLVPGEDGGARWREKL
ncbi:MAG: Rieske 2Fe-2S domain-containing protein [Methylococcaceae bacterium]|nr:Rieske 2Fe-2S domain-containing protein [Methylococcaceae bacterium]